MNSFKNQNKIIKNVVTKLYCTLSNFNSPFEVKPIRREGLKYILNSKTAYILDFHTKYRLNAQVQLKLNIVYR